MTDIRELSPIEDVPPEKVGQVVQDFIDFDSPVKIDVRFQSDGNYSVQAFVKT